MTGFNHVLTGITIAVTVKHPVLAPILAFLSHFVLDAIPHFGDDKRFVPWNRNFMALLSVDAVFCFTFLGLGIALFPEHWLLISVCAFMATLPDWLWILHVKFGKQHLFFDFHKWIQHSETPLGATTEVIFMILMVILLVLLGIDADQARQVY